MKPQLKNVVLVVLILGIVFLASVAVAATDNTNQNVTVTFSEIAELAVSGDPGTLTIAAPATPGDLPADVTENTTTMSWTCNVGAAATRKITGSLDVLFSGIKLYANITAAGSNGTSAGKTEFVAATTDYDFITGITNENVSAETITYTAEVTAMVAPYTDTTQIVTWTLTEDS